MPEAPPALLLLGNRSPYGLSVARAVLESGLRVRAVAVPSQGAWGRVRERALRASERRSDVLRRAVRRFRRALDGRSPREVPGGEPVPPPALDPGVTEGDLRDRCLRSGIAWHEVEEVRSERFLSLARETGAGVLLSASFPLLLPRTLLDLAEGGAINFHPSLLPRCRGSHPIFWTLASGETQGGVSAHLMTPEVDAGDLVAQIAIPLSDEDDYGSLYRRAMAASPGLVADVMAFLRGGRAAEAQDRTRATFFREDREQDHEVRFRERSAREVAALARAGGAFTFLRGQRLGIVKARPLEGGPRLRAGRLLEVSDEAFSVGAADGAVELRRVVWHGLGYGAGRLASALGLRAGEVLG